MLDTPRAQSKKTHLLLRNQTTNLTDMNTTSSKIYHDIDNPDNGRDPSECILVIAHDLHLLGNSVTFLATDAESWALSADETREHAEIADQIEMGWKHQAGQLKALVARLVKELRGFTPPDE